MDPINPWLDPAEVRRLAERLMKPARDPDVSCVEAGFDDDFVGFAGGRPASQAPRQAPPQAAEPLPQAASVFIAVPESAPEQSTSGSISMHKPAMQDREQTHEPHFPEEDPLDTPPELRAKTRDLSGESAAEGVRGPFLDRIHRFRDWMHHHFASTGLFILDREGSVIFDESNHGRLHFLARSLAQASRRQGASGGNVHVKIGAGATLEVIPVETAYGCLVLGAVVPESLSPEAVAAVMDALNQVAAPPAAGG